MKTVILTSVLFIALFTNAFASKTISGNSNSSNGEYSIEQASKSFYSIDYRNSIGDVNIEIKKDNGQTCYLVRTGTFEVMYVANNSGFGLRKMPLKWKTMEVSTSVFNKKAFLYQSRISNINTTKKESLKLIASFLPDVTK